MKKYEEITTEQIAEKATNIGMETGLLGPLALNPKDQNYTI